MDRRRFLQKSLTYSGTLAATSLTDVSAQDGLFEKLLIGVDQSRGSLLDRVDIVLRNANTAFHSLYHGYGLAIREILEGTDGPLPTTPERTHASWPHIHCVCHCNIVANLGPEKGLEVSRIGGIGDEVAQSFFARLFYESILPIVWQDQLEKYDGPDGIDNARRDMKYLLMYSFGLPRARKRALVLAAVADKENRTKLQDFRQLIYGLVDALESTWQQSDFYDNFTGREGGRQCPQGLTAGGRREWCSGWCTGHGVPTDAAEGHRTTRPFGPFHPFYPGPIPTIHDTRYGNLKEPFDPALNVPPPEFVPIRKPNLPGMIRLSGPRQV